ncbi:uncharacterized protein LOC131306676 isoform X4 [Rhododendron vialii]|uniref:uncharacterized protein LOC131306676 isoform X4 n=1 Tax=Rhododendron vialii TaxID=182163 RepID=UPI00265E64D4|nr:uncharacterized protein LOC131306676 isoform X4 [Rhododendron vialii]
MRDGYIDREMDIFMDLNSKNEAQLERSVFLRVVAPSVLGIEHKDMNYLIEFPTWWSFRFQNAAALDLRFVESEVCLGTMITE